MGAGVSFPQSLVRSSSFLKARARKGLFLSFFLHLFVYVCLFLLTLLGQCSVCSDSQSDSLWGLGHTLALLWVPISHVNHANVGVTEVKCVFVPNSIP